MNNYLDLKTESFCPDEPSEGRIADVLDERVTAGDRLYVTLMPANEQVMTFGSDNWQFLREAASRLVRSEQAKTDPDTYVVFARRFGEETVPGKVPHKTVAAYLVRREGIIPLSRHDVMAASATDHNTGRKLPPEPKVKYVDGLDLLPELQPYVLKAGGLPPTRMAH